MTSPTVILAVHPAAALGYGLGAATGAALAAKGRDRIVINVQTDGDFNYTPGAMWTAAHHELPMLTIMHNNRAWHMELMYVQYMAGVRGRGTDRAHIGTTLRDPYIDYAKLAAGYGVKSEGPIDDPTKTVCRICTWRGERAERTALLDRRHHAAAIGIKMSKIQRVARISAVLSLVFAAGAIAQVEFGPISGDATKGEKLYYDYGCYGCHGFNGIGRKNLANDVSGIMFREDVFLTYLRAREDLNPLFPTQNMPNYPEVESF